MEYKVILLYTVLAVNLINFRLIHGGVKTKTKTSTRYQSRFDSTSARVCDRPLPPDSGTLRCGMDNDDYVCTGECNEGYSFPDESRSFKLKCNRHIAQWEPYRSFQACERTPGADYEFIDSGAGTSNIWQQTIGDGGANAHSGMSERYSDFGSFQQQREGFGNFGTGLCKPLQQPQNGQKSCSMSNGAWTCQISCMSGNQFPDGSTQLTVTCDDRVGQWSPKDTFEDCSSTSGDNHGYGAYQQQRILSGGGDWTSYQTGGAFTGFGQDLCPSLQSPMNARKQCSMANGDWTCHIKCMDGYKFPDGNTELTVTCNSRVGDWSPTDTFENCRSATEGSQAGGYHLQQESLTGGNSWSQISQQTNEEDEHAFGNFGRYNLGAYGGSGQDLCPSLQSPMNARKQCSMANGDWTCHIKCMDGFKFPDGSAEVIVTCNSRVGQWSPRDTFENCRSSSAGGHGRGYNLQQETISGGGDWISQQTDEDEFGGHNLGTYGGFGQDLCTSLKSPMNARKQCSMANGDWTCHIKCMDGNKFPDGSSEITVTCNSRVGQWSPKNTFEDCTATSGGGHASGYNFQQDLCPPLKQPMNGGKQCAMSNGDWKCHVTCMGGYQFPDGNTELTVTCNGRLGHWSPTDTFEDCRSTTSGGHMTGYNQQQISGSGGHGSYNQISGSGGHGSYNQNQAQKLCQDPVAPQNGFIHCSGFSGQRTCQVTCNPGYEFTDRSRQLNINCYESNGRWMPKENFGDCQLLCHPPCQNGATCLHHNQCSCTDDYRGNRCQYAKSLCDFNKFSSGTPTADCDHNSEYSECQVSCPPGSTFDPPTSSIYRCTVNGLWNPPMPPRCVGEREELCKMPLSPDNGRIRCVSNTEVMQCSATCHPGYTFENAFEELSIQCVKLTGEWTPDIGFPNCQPICSPGCRNGGKCLGHNQCLCPAEYRGSRCEYALSLCDAHSRLASVIWECQNTQEESICNVKCNSGQKLQPGHTMVYKCRLDGTWEPDLKPTCVLAVSDRIMDPRSSHLAYSNYTSSRTSYTSGSNQQRQSQYEQYGGQETGGMHQQQMYRELNQRPVDHTFNQEHEFGQNAIDSDYDFGHGFNEQKTLVSENQIQSQYVSKQEGNRAEQGLEQFDIKIHDGGGHGVKTSYDQKSNRNIYELTDEDAQEVRKTHNVKGDEVKEIEIIWNKERSSDYKGICSVWGFYHYRTFDGGVFTYPSTCWHVLAESENDNYIIGVKSQCEGSLHCSRFVSIQSGNNRYELSYKDGISLNGVLLQLPLQDNDLVVEYLARYLVARTHFGYTIWINNENSVLVVAEPYVQGQTKGMCGNYDGNMEDSYLAKDGTSTPDVFYFANSWKIENPEGDCIDEAESKNPCSAETREKLEISNRANFACEAIKNADFQICAKVVEIDLYYAKCQMDCCSVAAEEGCECTSLAEFILECSRAGIDMLEGWRQPALCPLVCTNNTEYNECGPPCPATCEDQQPACYQEKCVDGCHCPQGMVLENGECISIEECPCHQGDVVYYPGDRIAQDCNTCVCEGGNWQCTDTVCPATCTMAGSHFTTFDGLAYDFYGLCPHYLVEADDFNVQVDYDASCRENSPTNICVKSITIHTPERAVVKMKPSMEVTVNGREMSHLPVLAPGVYVGQATSTYIKARLSNGLEILWDLDSSIHVYAPENLFGVMRGLCGTFTKNLQDELLTPEGDIETSPGAFTAKWRVEELCGDVRDTPTEGRHKLCDVFPERRSVAVTTCQVLKEDTFSECHALVDYERFYEDCLEDVCSCNSDPEVCSCLSLSNYANICARKGKPLSWRQSLISCGMACPHGQVYMPCANPCSYSCGEVANVPSGCRESCVEGCVCPQGQTLNEHGHCVSVSSCSCLHSGHLYPPEFLQRRGKNMCECSQGQWDCHQASAEDFLLTPPPRVAAECNPESHQVYTDCISTCPVTCSNFHHHQPCTVDVCVPGCKCEPGYIMEASSGMCVRPRDCPCHHAGRSYLEGEEVTMECNSCVCTGGSWKCESSPCPGVCSAWGDSHYETYDGKLYDFDGNCDYVLVKARVTDTTFFTVIAQNVPCGIGSSANCGKTLSVTLGDSTITLTRTHPLPKVPKNSKLSATSFGMFVLVDSDIGISVQWDRNTRVYITAQPVWKNRLQGLCGDFNSDASDDFRSPSGGMPLVLAKDFADSWRVHKFCQSAKQPQDACDKNPERRHWSRQKCEVLKSDLFKPCHFQVEVEDYYKRCMLDACACNSGGDCECLCAVVGAYALKCARKNIVIPWRSQDLCPVQCEACDRYSPCISLCPPANCDTYLEPLDSHSCSREYCVDGCEPKPCKIGHVHKSPTNSSCVPVETCDEKPCTVIDGVSYREGERIEKEDIGDACQSCYCRQGEVNCFGVPCLVVTQTSPLPQLHTLVEFDECKQGWTDWINSNIPLDNNGNDIEDLKTFVDSGRIPCSLEHVKDIQCRVALTQEPAELSGQQVTCDIPNGFTCKKRGMVENCYDYEMRVYCLCEAEEAMCPPGTEWKECAFDCEASCSSLLFDLKENGECDRGKECSPGCVKKVCEYPYVARDEVTCVTPDQCTCKLPTGFILAPGQVVENGCEKCQCLNNTVHCDTILECKPPAETEEVPDISTSFYTSTYEVFTMKPRMRKITSPPSRGLIQSTPACSYWSDWINKKKPKRGKRQGDREDTRPYILAQTEGFCMKGAVTAIECREAQTDRDYTETGEEKLVCNLKNGFLCENKHQPDSRCEDYKIRYFCTCEESTTPVPLFIRTTTQAYVYPCSDFVPLMNGLNPLPDSNIRASSSASPSSGPDSAKITDTGTPRAWTAIESNDKQFIEVDLKEVRAVYGIVTKGKQLSNEWVTSYQLVYSPDGASYFYVQDENDNNKVFSGNFDDIHEVKHLFTTPFEAKFVRIEPLTWEGKISLRFELLGCTEALITDVTGIEPGTALPPPLATVRPAPIKECVDPIGLADGVLLDDQFSATSRFSSKFAPEFARMGSDSVWAAGVLDEKQYLQIDFVDEANITGIKTKGREDIVQWVTAYFVEHSNDGAIWHKVKDSSGADKEFAANYDPYSVVANEFEATIRTRYIRILPSKWKNWISMQIEILGCYNPLPCRDPMGLDEDGLVTIHQLSSSSKISDSHSASNGRLSSASSWIPAKYDHAQFIQVDLLEPSKVTGIITKGDPEVQQWVTSYYVGFSNDSVEWKKVLDSKGKFKEFVGNTNHDSPTINLFPNPVISRYFRLLPIKWHRWTSVRLDLLGCSREQRCREPMGLENGLLSDGQISASSSYDWKTTPPHARINDKAGWQPDVLDKTPYLQVDFLEPRNVSAIATKGIEANNYWTSKYKVLSSDDGDKWIPVTDEDGDVLEFKGNKDRNSPVVNVFPEVVEARLFRIIPLEPRNAIGMRLELLGCYHPFVCQSPLGMESGETYDFQISTSSILLPSLSASNSRLDSDTAWVPDANDKSPYIQIDLLSPTNVTGLMTRGRKDAEEWVKSYTVSFSDDGVFWNGVKDEYGNNIEFKANEDSDSSVTNLFPKPIFSRLLRLKPTDYEKKVAVRLEVLGCAEDKVCMEPMGLEKGMLSDGQITASSFKSENNKPSDVRLNSKTSWSPVASDDYQYIKVDFGDPRNISAVVTKGDATMPEWVTSFEVMHSKDGVDWDAVKNAVGQNIIFTGNVDNNTPAINVFPDTLEAQFVKIVPKDWKNGISLRAEILGCYHPYEVTTPPLPEAGNMVKAWTFQPTEPYYAPTCPNPMDEESSLLENAQIKASSSVPGGDVSRLPLDTRGGRGGLKGAWVPKVEDMHPYLLIEFHQPKWLTSIYIQGREDAENWVTSLRVIASPDNKTWLPVFGPNGEEIIEGNEDQDSLVGHYFKQAVETQYIKVIPESWHNWPSFRLDLRGCQPEETPTPPTHLCPELAGDPDLAISCPAVCPPGTLCDGKECVDPVDCVCVQNGKIFKISDKIEDQECRECFCSLGGQSRCVEKKCPLCAENERSIMNADCTCSCQECEPNKVLCPSSHECIVKQRWCDGIVDCPDDETNCPTTTEVSTIPLGPIIATTPPPPENATCDVMGKHIRTFDGQDITYDICHHVIMKDTRNGTFNVTLHKQCSYTGDCKHWLEVRHKNHHVKVTSDLKVEWNGHNYTAFVLSNLKKKPKSKNFFVEKIGDQVIIKSLVKGFTVIYDNKGHLKIEAVPSLKTRLGGLCGYYSGRPQDDQKKPDGKQAYTSKEFGDSWTADENGEVCAPSICPHDVMVKALEQCNKLKEDPFTECGKVLVVDHFIEFCMSSTCECMLHMKESEERCKCDSFQPFVDACEEKLGQAAVRNWRFKHSCHSDCPPGMEWNDCGPSCQLTCDITSEESLQACSGKCVSGCFCPPGTVLNEDSCIPPNQCTDKTCQGFGDPHLKTFDGLFFPFLAEGSFLIVGDVNKQFTLSGFSRRCSFFSHATCLSGLQLKYKIHTITIKKHKDIQVDDAIVPMDQLPLHSDGMVILGYPGRTFVIVVPQISLEVRYYEDNSGFAVKVPSRRYFNKTEGLCGNCNGKKDDEVGDKPLSEFVCSFQTEGDVDECKKSLDKLPEIKERNPLCEKLAGPVFEACHPLLDMEVYLDACSFDAVHSGKSQEALCKTAMEYARQCCQMGIAINDWPQKLDCDMKCPDELHYEQCHKGCPQTCASLKNSSGESLCIQLKTDGCFCPEGKVLHGDECVDVISCETCDDKGHVPGDTWRDGDCKTCVCDRDLKIECAQEICPEKPICSENEALIKIERETEHPTCCERFSCAPKKEDCPPPKIPNCPEGQVAKMHTRKQKCPEFECECDPALCGDVVWPTDLEVGQFVEKLNTLCCPKIRISCNVSSCPVKLECGAEMKLLEAEGECCKIYKCKPLEDVCVYLHQFEIVDGFETTVKLEDSEPVLYKPGDEWEDGLCEKCKCDSIGRQNFPNCVKEQCNSPLSTADHEDYVLRVLKVPDKCCPEIYREQCKDHDGNVYHPGEQWSDLEDPCISYTCEEKEFGGIQITKNKITCQVCPKNAELIPPSKFLGQCCGICHMTKCEEDDQLHEVGETWKSDNHPCRVAECVREFGSVKIIYTKQSCPTVPKDCPKSKIMWDENGCCEVCNITSEISCSSGPIPEEDTIGFFTFEDRNHGGICTNDKPMNDILRCSGACHSQSYYSLEDGDFKDTCKCCKVNVTVNRVVELRCPDGNKIKKTFLQPETCQCSKCAPKDPKTGRVKTIDFSKTNRNSWSQSDIGQIPFGQEAEREFEPLQQKDFDQQREHEFSFQRPQQEPENFNFFQQHQISQQQQEEDDDFSQLQQLPQDN